MSGQTTPQILLIGAGCFGGLIGWLIYYTNRYREGTPKFSDIVTVVGIIGGAAILNLFPAETDIFGAYGIGLASGFFLYFVSLLILVKAAKFPWAWFLDGRTRAVGNFDGIEEYASPYSPQTPMVRPDDLRFADDRAKLKDK